MVYVNSNILHECPRLRIVAGFYLNLPLGAVVALPILLLHIPNEVVKQPALTILRRLYHYLDLVGFALFAPAVIMLLLDLQLSGEKWAWNSSQAIGLFCGSGVTFIIWLIWNIHAGENALLPPHIIRRRVVWVSGLNYTFMVSTLFAASYFLPIYFQAVKGVSALVSGVRLLPTILPQMVAAIVSGTYGKFFGASFDHIECLNFLTTRTVGKVGFVPPFAIFSATLTAVASGLYALFQPGTSTGEWAGFQVINGVGRGTGIQMVREDAFLFRFIISCLVLIIGSTASRCRSA